MIEFFFSLIALVVTIGFIAFALWFGLALILAIMGVGFLLGAAMVLRGYYLRWKYGAPETQETIISIDGEYEDVTRED